MNKFLEKLGVKSFKQLIFFCYSKKNYNVFNIYQKNGKIRKITAPKKALKWVQSNILRNILYIDMDRHLINECTGFIPQKSIIDNSVIHIGKETIINIDIENFFPSITREQVYNMFRGKFNFSNKDSYYLSRLTTHNNYLPQGAPSSPMIANYVSSCLDKRLKGYLESIDDGNGFSYSRYADDITIGFNGDINIHWFISNIYEIVESEGFMINLGKTRVLTNYSRQDITGLIINSGKPTVGRKKMKKYRAIFHSISKKGRKKSHNIWNLKNGKYKTINEFRSHLKGRLSFIKPLYPNYYNKYILLFDD